MTPQPCRRIAIIQEMESPGRLLQTRTVIGLLPYDKEECDRMMRFIPEQYAASRPAPSPSELAATAYQAGIECGREEGAAQAREKLLAYMEQNYKRRYVEDAVAEIRRFPESLRTGGEPR